MTASSTDIKLYIPTLDKVKPHFNSLQVQWVNTVKEIKTAVQLEAECLFPASPLDVLSNLVYRLREVYELQERCTVTHFRLGKCLPRVK